MSVTKAQKCKSRFVVLGGCGLLLLGSVAQPDMVAYAEETGAATTQQAVQQSDRWEGSGDTWRVRASNGSGYLTNSWFQDLDGSWYMLGADGIMYSGLVTDQSTGKSYLLNTQHDGTFGRMLTTDGVYNVNGVNVYLTFNQNHDGTFGAITSGLNEVRSSGVRETSLAAIPTDSATGNTSQGASATSQNQTASGSYTDEQYRNMTYEEAIKLPYEQQVEWAEAVSGGRVITDGQMSNEVVDLQG